MDQSPTNLPGKATPPPKEIFLPKKEEKKDESKNAATKVFAVIGLAGILALLSLGIVKFAPDTVEYLTSAAVSLSSKFIPGTNPFTGPLTLSSDKRALNSGDAFALTWIKKGDEKGEFVISYPCKNGFHLEAPQENENMLLTCDTKYTFGGEARSLDLIAFSTQNLSLEVPVTLDFIKDGSEEVTYSSEITITVTETPKDENQDIVFSPIVSPMASPSASTSPILTPSPKPTPPRAISTPRPSTYVTTQSISRELPNGKPDLVIRVLETGVLNKTTGAFTQKSQIKKTDKAAVRFEVENIGTKRSGAWEFESKLPTKVNYTYSSGNQVSLMPRDKVQYIFGFDEFKAVSTLSFSIEVDPQNSEDELTENNNISFVNIEVDN